VGLTVRYCYLLTFGNDDLRHRDRHRQTLSENGTAIAGNNEVFQEFMALLNSMKIFLAGAHTLPEKKKSLTGQF